MDPNKIAVRIQATVRKALPDDYSVRLVAYDGSDVDFEIYHRGVEAGRVGGFAVDEDGVAFQLEAMLDEAELSKTAGIRTYVRSVVNYAIEQTYNEINQQEAA